MNHLKQNLPLLAVVAITSLMLLPFLGLTDFNTKGEPREAVVALSMLKDGNWILPVNNGCDIPYKPPFFHFCIALFSLLSGSVSEYTSRLPSALSFVAMTTGVFVFYRRRTTTATAFLATVLLATSFEVHRYANNCRVDMMLTAFTVGSLLLFYKWREQGSRGIPVLAVLCMSGAVMTKGPVGFILPCFVMVSFSLLRGDRPLPTLLRYALAALLSCLIPAAWYIAAWQQGGDQFLSLVYEENIGRMTGTMSYESHEHAFTYNFFTLFTGWVPWTLLMMFSLFALPWRKLRGMAAIRPSLSAVSDIKLFTWLCFLLVLFFYCLPSSKRSVYLLPCYPFMAVLMAQYIQWLWATRRRGCLRVYVYVIASLSLLLTVAYVTVRMGLVPDGIFHGKHAAENIAMLHSLRDGELPLWSLLLIVLQTAVCLDALQLAARGKKDIQRPLLYAMTAPVVTLMIVLDGVYLPAILNSKSLRPMAQLIEKTFPGEPLYQYIDDKMMHFFGADFYLNDSMAQFETPQRSIGVSTAGGKAPERGVLVVPEGDFAALEKRHPEYTFTHVMTTERRMAEVKGCVSFYRFALKHAE